MSEAMENTASACDRLLDYVYGELGGDELEQFKLHLLTCEKCKRELAGLERVRSAVKQAMPPMEPPVDKMAQLMHAAAQHKPKRGKVLMFARRVVSHPAYAAAAVFVLVATTVTVNMSRNAFKMPAPEAMHEPVEAPKTAVAQGPAPAGAAAPAGARARDGAPG
jgi:anti-sigma factor RsiW